MSKRTEIDIEALLWWTYQRQKADVVADRLAAHTRPSGYSSNAGQLAQQARLGVRVDNPTILMASSRELHPDAERVHDQVRQMGAERVGLIMTHAKIGDRPDWMPAAVPACRPERRGNGAIKVVWTRSGRHRPDWCPVVYDPSVDTIVWHRRVYVIWHDALSSLADALDDLDDHVALYPAAARQPWLQGRGGAATALDGERKLDYVAPR